MAGARLPVRVNGRMAGALCAQLVNAGGSLVVQLVAARALGAHTFGTLVLLTSALVLITALHTSFVGDSYTVLDRDDPAVRGAVLVAHVALSASAAAAGYALAAGVAGLGHGAAVAFAGLTVLWLQEELGRRVLMARQQFWKLAANDAVYVAVALSTLGLLALARGSVSLLAVLASMAAGAAAAVGAAAGQLPPAALRPGRPAPGMLRELAGFAVWRALQAGLTPLLLFLARAMISLFAGRAVLGQAEAARLLIAPAQTVVNAAGNVLLPAYSSGAAVTRRRVLRPSLLLAGATGLVGAVAVAGAGPAGRLLVGEEIAVPRAAVLAWVLYTATFALGLPAATALVARRQSGAVFAARLADGVVGVGLLVALLAAGQAHTTPAALAVARAGSSLWLYRLVGREAGEAGRGAAVPAQRLAEAPVAQAPLGEVPPADAPPAEVPLGEAPLSAPMRAPRAAARPMPRLLGSRNRWALAAVVLPLMLASDYKLRVRDARATVSGRPDPFVLAEIGVYAAVAGVLLLTVARAPAGRRNPVVISLAWVVGLYALLAALWSPFPALAVVRGLQLALIIAIAQAVARYASREQLHGLAHAFIVLVALSVLVGVVTSVPPVSQTQAGRFTWLYVHPVVAGVYLGVAAVAAALYLTAAGRAHRVWPAWAYVLALLVAGVALAATRTRGAMLATAVAAVVVVVLGARPGARAGVLAAAGVVAALVLLTSAGEVARFLARDESAEKLATLNERTTLWSLALDLVGEKPLTGWGLTASRGIFLDEIGLGGGHNAFVNMLVDGGLIGLVLWLALLVALVATLCRRWSPAARGAGRADATLLAALLVFLLIDGQTVEYLAAPANVANIWLFVLVGWAGALTRRPGQAPRAGHRPPAGRRAGQPSPGPGSPPPVFPAPPAPSLA
ncbi:MAG: O-antigen ligase family protein, partial [Frankia sp.]|nr:O-antigen ligase family protein [Frankia sp.]